MQAVSFEEAVDLILTTDTRYHRDAYFFVREALDHTQKTIGRSSKDEIHHITGQELLVGIRAYGLLQFGPMTLTVFNEWGLRGCEDFGEIVFNMVESNLLAKTETDSREDFKSGYDFVEAFCRPFLPSRQVSTPAPEPRSTNA